MLEELFLKHCRIDSSKAFKSINR